jgi:hypothetical protein
MISIHIEEQYANKVNGLCGNYNKENLNDLLLPDQTFTDNPITFGNSWKTDSSVINFLKKNISLMRFYEIILF